MSDSQNNQLPELDKESRIGGVGKLINREIPLIDLTDFSARRTDIAEQLWQAACEVGFFQLSNHGVDSQLCADAFALTEAFFALPEEQKAQLALQPGTNAGWEYMSQVRPSTGQQDQKESYQITVPRMLDLWPQLHQFKITMLAFERANWALGMRVLSCFADKLGFDNDFFTTAHDPTRSQYQSTLRLLHYLPLQEIVDPDSVWRAGAHTDFDCLTLLHQQPEQGGLQLCPGKEADDMEWTDIEPLPGLITCNIGDMLMRWSDDALKSTLHRVKMPAGAAQQRSRYSLAFFCQANTDIVIESPGKRYPAITAADYLHQRISANQL